jgi:hypothetical protein
MPSVIYAKCHLCQVSFYSYAECHNAEYHYAECCYAECRSPQQKDTQYNNQRNVIGVNYAKCFVLYCYAECHYAECHYAECYGALAESSQNVL